MAYRRVLVDGKRACFRSLPLKPASLEASYISHTRTSIISSRSLFPRRTQHRRAAWRARIRMRPAKGGDIVYILYMIQ